MTTRTTFTVTVGASMGSFTRQKVCHGEAPSIFAASITLSGTVCRPARYRTTFTPKLDHTITQITVATAQVGSDRNGSECLAPTTALTAPSVPRIDDHRKPRMTGPTT